MKNAGVSHDARASTAMLTKSMQSTKNVNYFS